MHTLEAVLLLWLPIVTSKCAIKKNIETYLIFFNSTYLFVPRVFLSRHCHYLSDVWYNSSHLRTNSINFLCTSEDKSRQRSLQVNTRSVVEEATLFTLSELSRYRPIRTHSVTSKIRVRQRRRNGTETWRRRSCQCEHPRFFVCSLLGNSPASEFYMPTFRNTLFHLHGQVGVDHSTPTCLWRWKRRCFPKRRHIKFRRRGIAQKKAYNIQNTAKVLNQESAFNYTWENFTERWRSATERKRDV